MKISHKIIAIIIVISLCLIILGNWLFDIFIKNYLITQENMQIKTNINNVVSSLQEKESNYKSFANDWAHWDETYDYINTSNPTYVELNLTDQSINVLNINLMIFYNNENKIINKVSYDLEKKEFTSLPPSLVANIDENVKKLKQGQDSTLIISSDNQFYIIAMSRITDSLLLKAENGTLVVGRLIDSNIIKDFENRTDSKVSFSSISDMDSNIIQKLVNISPTENIYHICTINDEKDTITANFLIGKPTNNDAQTVVTIAKPMNIYKQGIAHIQILQIIYSMLIVLLIIIIFFSIKMYISNPIFNITKYLNNINLSTQKFSKLPVIGNDELSTICRSINNMLNKISIQHEEFRKSEERLTLAQTIAHVGNWELDLEEKTIWASDEAMLIYGIDNAIGKFLLQDIQTAALPEYRQMLDEAFEKLITKNEKYEVEFEIRRKSDGEKRFLYSRAKLLLNQDEKPFKVIGIIHDITERKEYEQKIIQNSYHDSLTGLYNRRYIDEEMDRIDVSKNLPISVVIGDVNGLKLANDVYGHKNGDKILNEIAKIIKNSCRATDIIARWGGDEFIILMPNTNSDETQKIINNIKNDCSNTKVDSIILSISLGYYIKKTTSQDMDIVFKNAEDYMYRHKLIETTSMRGKTINTLLHTLYEKNPREEAHSRRVSDICVSIGTAMGLIETDINKLKVIGLIHDIGKIAIQEHILNKPGKLDNEEWIEIKRHPEIGYRILSSTNEMAELSEHILKHHERLDGSGYPSGLNSDDIPLMTRILTVADAYDAMTSVRAYQNAMSQEAAIAELKKYSGTHFDEKVVDVLINRVLKD